MNQATISEISLSFTPEELRELTKQLFLANFMALSCDYGNHAIADGIMLKVCASGYLEASETGGFTHNGIVDPAFTFSMELDDEWYPLLELFKIDCMEEYLPLALAERDLNSSFYSVYQEKLSPIKSG